jgi:hypothetical protein
MIDTDSLHASEAPSVSEDSVGQCLCYRPLITTSQEKHTVDFLRSNFYIRPAKVGFEPKDIAPVPTNAFGRIHFYPKDNQGWHKAAKVPHTGRLLVNFHLQYNRISNETPLESVGELLRFHWRLLPKPQFVLSIVGSEQRLSRRQSDLLQRAVQRIVSLNIFFLTCPDPTFDCVVDQ